MIFNSDHSKQAQEIIFSRKKMKSSHPSVYFNNIRVSSTSVHKHLGMYLDDTSSYEHHLKFVLNKVQRKIGLFCKFQQILLRKSLITIYKSFIWSHLHYRDIFYERAFNDSFHHYLEPTQYNPTIAINGAKNGLFFEKLFWRIRLRIDEIKTSVKKIMFILQNCSWKIFLFFS